MLAYKNIGGDSGVAAYESGPEHIRVQFSTGAVYLYTYQSAGSSNIEQMKRLAESGQGLNSFIGTVVKKQYAMRER